MGDRHAGGEPAIVHTDQYGYPWLVINRNGDRWAWGLDLNDLPIGRKVFDDEILLDYGEPKALRKLAKAVSP